MKTGTVFLPSIESRSAGASQNILAEKQIPSHLQHIIVTILAPCFYMERLAHLCFHTGTVHCQRVIQNKCIPVSIRVFPYGNGD